MMNALLLILALIVGALAAVGLGVLALSALVDRLIDEIFPNLGD